MGVLKKLFGKNKPAPSPTAAPLQAGSPTVGAAAPRSMGGVEAKPTGAPLRPSATANDRAASSPPTRPAPQPTATAVDRGPAADPHSTTALAEAPQPSTSFEDIVAPKNKQELFKELQRNYREVVSLIHKVDGHLDDQSQRAGNTLEIAKRVDEILPRLAELSSTNNTQLEGLRTELTAAIHALNESGGTRAARLERVVHAVGKEIASAAANQQKLVATMAQFRETMSELVGSSNASARAVQAMSQAAVQRDKDLITELARTRRWVTICLVALGLVALSSMGIALSVLL